MTKKCNCKKCVYCKRIVTGTAIFRVICEKYGEEYMPTYCDQYTTEKEFEIQQQKTNFEKKCEEYVRVIVKNIQQDKILNDKLSKIINN